MSSIASQIQSMAASYGIPPSLALAVAQKESEPEPECDFSHGCDRPVSTRTGDSSRPWRRSDEPDTEYPGRAPIPPAALRAIQQLDPSPGSLQLGARERLIRGGGTGLGPDLRLLDPPGGGPLGLHYPGFERFKPWERFIRLGRYSGPFEPDGPLPARLLGRGFDFIGARGGDSEGVGDMGDACIHFGPGVGMDGKTTFSPSSGAICEKRNVRHVY